MKQYKSSLFGSILCPGSFEELLKLMRTPPSSEYGAVRMWRGQADISWPVHSSAYRRLSIDKPPTENDLINYEEGLMERAAHRGFRHLDGRRLSDFELLARLQHHGAATRLVDATRSCLIGLYFCAVSKPNSDGALIGVHSNSLGGYEGALMEMNYRKHVGNIGQHKHPQTWQPTEVSPRIAAQHSQFLYSTLSPDKKGSLCFDKDSHSLLVIAISPDMKKKSLTILSEVFDINHLTLFPDFDGFATGNSQMVSNQEAYRW